MRRNEKREFLVLLLLCTYLAVTAAIGCKAKAASVLGKEYDGNYGYTTLSKQLKDCYIKINKEMEQFHHSSKNASASDGHHIAATIDVSRQKISLNELKRIMFAIDADHPRYFWYEGTSYTYENGKTNIKEVRVTVAKEYVKGGDRNKKHAQLVQAVRRYTSVLDEMKRKKERPIEKEQYIHDALIETISYGTGKSKEENTVIGAFVNRSSCCEGYSKAFQLLMNYAGMECIYAVGYGYDEGHAWNLVKMDGNWYNVDVTWDDIGEGISYRYFNCLDDTFLVSHAYSKDFAEMYPVPKVSKVNSYEYYQYHHLNFMANDYKTKAAFCDKAIKAANAILKHDDLILHIQVKEQDTAKFLRMWKENKAEIQNKLKKNGIFYEFGNPVCTEDVVTITNKVIFTYEVPIRKYSVVGLKNDIYFELPAIPVYVDQTGQKRKKLTQTETRYKNGKVTVYYNGNAIGTYPITVKAPVISKIPSYTYHGGERCPKPTVTVGKTKLKLNVDYTITYKDNKNAGKANMILTGIGKYSGKKKVSFEIKKRAISSCTVSTVKKQTYTGKAIKPGITVTYKGKVLKNKKDYKISYYNNKRKGNARIVIRGIGTNFKGTKTIKFRIA